MASRPHRKLASPHTHAGGYTLHSHVHLAICTCTTRCRTCGTRSVIICTVLYSALFLSSPTPYITTPTFIMTRQAMGSTLRVVLQQSSSVGQHSQTWQPTWGCPPCLSLSRPTTCKGMAVRYTTLEACRYLRNHASRLPAWGLHAWGPACMGTACLGTCMHGDCLYGDCMHGDCELGNITESGFNLCQFNFHA